MKSAAKDALVDIIKSMKKLNLEKVNGFKNKVDEDPSISIEEDEDDEEDELDD